MEIEITKNEINKHFITMECLFDTKTLFIRTEKKTIFGKDGLVHIASHVESPDSIKIEYTHGEINYILFRINGIECSLCGTVFDYEGDLKISDHQTRFCKYLANKMAWDEKINLREVYIYKYQYPLKKEMINI